VDTTYTPTAEAPRRFEINAFGCSVFVHTQTEADAAVRDARSEITEGEYGYVIDHASGQRWEI
jgi:hypothetical protein